MNHNKIKLKIIAGLISLSTIISCIPINAYAKTPRNIGNFKVSQKTISILDRIESNIDYAQKHPTEENIKKAINSYINKSMLNTLSSEENQFLSNFLSGLRLKIYNCIEKLSNDKKYELFEFTITKSFETDKYFKDCFGKELFIDHKELRERENLKPYWNSIKNLPDVLIDAQEDSNANLYTGKLNDDIFDVPESVEKEIKQKYTIANEDYYNNNHKYILKNNKCYEEQENYKNGKLVNITHSPVPNIYCALLDSSIINNNNNDNINDNSVNNILDELYKQNEAKSNITLQYSLNKNEDNSQYYDSGIRISLKNTITYSQAKDVMYQVTIKNKGQFIEDENKFMCLIEKRLFILKDNKKEIPIKEFENMFDGFNNVEVKALNTKIGTTCSLSDYIGIKKVNTIYVNNSKKKINNNPIIKENIALLPIEEIAKLIDADVINNKTEIIIKKDNSIIKYKENCNTVNINCKEVKIKTKVRKNSKGILMGEIQPMLNNFKYEIIWDSDSNLLNINKK